MKRLTSKQLKMIGEAKQLEMLGEVPEWDVETIRSEVPEWELEEDGKEHTTSR
jgi:hypothetical protein